MPLTRSTASDPMDVFRRLAESIPQLVWTTHGDGRMEYVNAKWVEYTGLTDSWAWKQAVHPFDLQPFVDHWNDAVLKAQPFQFECRLRRRDGFYRRFAGRAEPVPAAEGFPTLWFVVCTDVEPITHRDDVRESQRIAAALRESEEFNRQIVASANEGIAVYDLDRHCRAWNPFMHRLTGLSPGQVLGRDPLELFPALQENGFADAFLRATQGETVAIPDMQYPATELRSEVWASSRLGPLRDARGEVVGVTSMVQDITERKRVEEALREARRIAEASSRSKSEFLANMSHEIRTPMTAILGYADLLAGHLNDPDDLQCVETIRRNGRFLLEIINDILDISKIEAGKMELNPQPISAEAVIADVVSLMDVRAAEKQIPLRVEVDGVLPKTIHSDPVRLRQILLNLVGNAIKFTDAGEVTLGVRLLAEKRQLQFDIVDTGIGISPAQQKQLFQPFTQADASVTRQHGGTGLGLVISRRLARLLGGDLKVQSQPNEGSTFSVTVATGSLDGVPLVRSQLTAAGEAVEEESPAALPSLDCRVLVVDDRRDIRFLAQHFVEEAGGQVLTAQNGQEALDLLTSDAPPAFDIVVMDISMPVMDGYTAARRLRVAGFQGAMIALTANAMQGDRAKCLQAGFDDYTTKPLDRRRFVELIARYTRPRA